jgi:ribosome maturation factor RimP
MVENKVEQLIKPLIEDMGYELWGCEYLPQGKHSILRIYIDKSGGIGIEDCQNVSYEVSALLDVEDPITSHYSLEVSSPGVPRPLFYSWQYQRYIGKTVQVKLYQPFEGRRKYVGAIVSANETELVLLIDDVAQHFSVSNIVKANLIVE